MVKTPLLLRYVLRIVVVGYLFLLVAWPVSLVVRNTFADGFDALSFALADPNVIHALQLTAVVAVISVVINTVFGVTISLLIVRNEFPGRRLLTILLDVPMSVSPVVVGLALVLVFNSEDGWFGTTLAGWGIQIIYSTPGIVLATVFVALPLVIREIIPTLQEVGDEQEWAARSLGANAVQTFRLITLPTIKWAVIYGVVLALARSVGEYGAVKIVSGNVIGSTQTATLLVEERYQAFDQPTAYAVAFMLAMAAVICIVIVAILRPKHSEA
ncbi:sulfate ABC transporter permease subunit [Nocardioides cavernaquae]|uniref:Sulfate ABC transporter permease subunit n=1 Tax=Nocardioides cavernaquae TaxID=2321396 RepID=A0A3A5HE27_9ACTN|nr:sulfate ABC transporter permease subunit [Nocardioides cavernaquae]RJS46157.1 sulfate ABC transporter permease subunit [Nocardioides cavernaquae]